MNRFPFWMSLEVCICVNTTTFLALFSLSLNPSYVRFLVKERRIWTSRDKKRIQAGVRTRVSCDRLECVRHRSVGKLDVYLHTDRHAKRHGLKCDCVAVVKFLLQITCTISSQGNVLTCSFFSLYTTILQNTRGFNPKVKLFYASVYIPHFRLGGACILKSHP